MRPKSLVFLGIALITLYLIVTVFLRHADIREYSERQNKKYRPRGELVQDKKSVIVDESNDNYFVFIQISDLHISSSADHNRTPDFRYFCKEIVPLVSPDFVIVSGDLTNAITLYRQDATQIVDEWMTYEQVLKETKVLSKTKWLDLKGNHDQFNVPSHHHADNFFKQYSVQGKQHLQSYRYVNRKKFGIYSIIALDACPTPGLKRPYNFFGLITPSDVNFLKYFIRSSENDNLTIWFGHYPTSSIIAPKIDLRSLIGRSGLVYLTGHLHTIFFTIYDHMFALQPQGFLELELSDWKATRKFRICVVDHDIFSFVDVYLYDWPILIITNPKDSNYIVPHKEAVYRIMFSTHIRMFAWSPEGIQSVKVFINDKYLGEALQSPRSPLFTISWDPSSYDPGKHHVISVEVKDRVGRIKVFTQNFNSAGKPSWEFFFYSSSFILMDMPHVMRFLYYVVWSILLVGLIILRLFRYMRGYIMQLNCQYIHGMYKLANYDLIFYSVIIYLFYCTWGPLIIGQLVERHWAVVFLHGIYVSNTYIPDGITYFLEFVQLVVFVVPVLLYFSYLLSVNASSSVSLLTDKWLLWRNHRIFMALLIIQAIFTFFSVFVPYGLVCTLFSPCRFWLIPGTFYLFYSLNQMPSSTTDSSTMTHRISNSSFSDAAPNPNAKAS